jgi:hypothetical protein
MFLWNAAWVCGEIQRNWIEVKCQIRNRRIFLVVQHPRQHPKTRKMLKVAICLFFAARPLPLQGRGLGPIFQTFAAERQRSKG